MCAHFLIVCALCDLPGRPRQHERARAVVWRHTRTAQSERQRASGRARTPSSFFLRAQSGAPRAIICVYHYSDLTLLATSRACVCVCVCQPRALAKRGGERSAAGASKRRRINQECVCAKRGALRALSRVSLVATGGEAAPRRKTKSPRVKKRGRAAHTSRKKKRRKLQQNDRGFSRGAFQRQCVLLGGAARAGTEARRRR